MLFRIITLACHLLCVNLAAAGPLLCVWLEWWAARRNRARSTDPPARQGSSSELALETAQRLAQASLLALQFGILLGGANVYWLYRQGQTQLLHAALRLEPRLWWGVAEIAFTLICLLGYLAWFRYGSRHAAWQRIIHRFLAVAAGTNLLYHFPPLFSILSQLAHDSGDGVLTSAEYRTWLIAPSIMAKTAHVWGASIAVAGIALSYLVPEVAAKKSAGSQLSAHDVPSTDVRTPAQTVRAWGAIWCLVGTLMQLPTGLWVLATLPTSQQYAVLGSDTLATTFLGLSVFLSFLTLTRIAQSAYGNPTQRDIVLIIAHVGMIVVLMVGTMLRMVAMR